MSRLRAIALIAALFSGLLQAAELKVAVGVQDPAQVSMQGNLLPSSTPGADLVAVNDELAREICRRINARCAFFLCSLRRNPAGRRRGPLRSRLRQFSARPRARETRGLQRSALPLLLAPDRNTGQRPGIRRHTRPAGQPRQPARRAAWRRSKVRDNRPSSTASPANAN